MESSSKRLRVPPEISYIILEHIGMPMDSDKETIKHSALLPATFGTLVNERCSRRSISSQRGRVHTFGRVQSPVPKLFAALTVDPSLASITRHLTCRCKWDGNGDQKTLETALSFKELVAEYLVGFSWNHTLPQDIPERVRRSDTPAARSGTGRPQICASGRAVVLFTFCHAYDSRDPLPSTRYELKYIRPMKPLRVESLYLDDGNYPYCPPLVRSLRRP